MRVWKVDYKYDGVRTGFALILTILFLFAACASSFAAYRPVAGKLRKVRLIYGLAVKNRGSRVIEGVTIHVPEIGNYPPHQSATIRSISPASFTRETSPSGVPMLKVHVDRIVPKERKMVLVSADVVITDISYAVSEEEAQDPDASMRRFLDLDECFRTESPALKAQCREFTGEKNPLKRALRIYDYIISGTYSFSNSPVGLGIDHCFEKKHLNCSDAAALYLVMCRLCGIPARYVSGIFYSSARKWYPLLHAWTEIYIPPFGWLPVDPTLGRLSEENRRLCFAHIRNRYIELWNNQFSAFYIEAPSEKDTEDLEVRNSICAEP
jgi:hypothetical protein